MNALYRPTLATLALSIAVSACDTSQPPSAGNAQAPAATAAPAATPDTASEPAVASMKLAVAVETGKVGVPVDVRYELAGVAAKNQPASLDIAFVPRAEGSNLQVSFIGSESASIDAGGASLVVAKAEVTSAYRRRLTVTPRLTDTGDVRVQVVMDVAGGRYSSIFTIPVSPAAAAASGK